MFFRKAIGAMQAVFRTGDFARPMHARAVWVMDPGGGMR